jgi:2-dehydro-3-deoxyphosphogluconate aldolase/(4S)-4-hydroxy-2-oxoglutarate aldolase
VKLYPAASLGPGYWSSLAGPLKPLPFCIAAGGLSVADVRSWLEAGVDAVAIGSQLFACDQGELVLQPELPSLLAWLRQRAEP